jgi:hypothetical protein
VASHAVEFFHGLYNTARNREHAAFMKAAMLSSDPFFNRCPSSTRGVKGEIDVLASVDYMTTMNLARELIDLHEEFIEELRAIEISFDHPTCSICGCYWCVSDSPAIPGMPSVNPLAVVKKLFDTLSDGLISEE